MNDELENLDLSHEAAVKAIREKFTPTPEEFAERELAELEDHGNLKNRELTEKLISQLYEAKLNAKKWADIEAMLKAEAKDLVGKDRGLINRGQWILEVKERAGQRRLNKDKLEAWIKGEIGGGIPEHCYDTGDPQVIIEPKPLK